MNVRLLRYRKFAKNFATFRITKFCILLTWKLDLQTDPSFRIQTKDDLINAHKHCIFITLQASFRKEYMQLLALQFLI
jgi:hypothetical protein